MDQAGFFYKQETEVRKQQQEGGEIAIKNTVVQRQRGEKNACFFEREREREIEREREKCTKITNVRI
jgi:hypothetical protein